MDPMFSFVFSLTQHDYIASARSLARRDPPAIFLLLVCFINLSFSGYNMFFLHVSGFWNVLAGAGCFVFWLIRCGYLGYHNLDPQDPQERYTFFDEQYCLERPSLRSISYYSSIFQLYETENTLVIRRQGSAPLLLPKSVLASGEKERFCTFLSEKTGQQWRVLKDHPVVRIALPICIAVLTGVLFVASLIFYLQ